MKAQYFMIVLCDNFSAIAFPCHRFVSNIYANEVLKITKKIFRKYVYRVTVH